MRALSVRLAVGALVAAAASLVASGTAHAATCGGAHGVSVVVDFHQLGGVETACDAGGAGETAARQLTDVGHTLTYVQRQPGFVCRVDGAPSSDPCVDTPPSDAYWSVWWSDGKSGKWSYSSEGVGALQVPDGGYVALSWQGGSAKAPPRAAATAHPTHTPSPSPSGTPKPHPTSPPPSGHPSRHPTSQASSGPRTTRTSSAAAPRTASASPSPSTTRKAQITHHASRLRANTHPSQSHPATVTGAGGPPSSTGSEGSGSGLPGWVAPGAVALVFAAAAAVAVVRRKRSGSA